MPTNNKKFEIFVDIKRRTEKAVLVFDKTIEAWPPLSLIDVKVDPNRKNYATVTLAEWLAK